MAKRVSVFSVTAIFAVALTAWLNAQQAQVPQQGTIPAAPATVTKQDIQDLGRRLNHELKQGLGNVQSLQERLGAETARDRATEARAERQRQAEMVAKINAAQVAQKSAIAQAAAAQKNALQEAAHNLRIEIAAAALALMFCGALFGWWIQRGRDVNTEKPDSLSTARRDEERQLPLNPTQTQLRQRMSQLGVSELKFILTPSPDRPGEFQEVEVVAVSMPNQNGLGVRFPDKNEIVGWKDRRSHAARRYGYMLTANQASAKKEEGFVQ